MSEENRLSKAQYEGLVQPLYREKIGKRRKRHTVIVGQEPREAAPSDLDSDHTKLPSGRELFTRGGFIGINQHCQLTQGFSDNVDGADLELLVNAKYYDARTYMHLSRADKLAIADMMINRWQIYKSIAEEELR